MPNEVFCSLCFTREMNFKNCVELSCPNNIKLAASEAVDHPAHYGGKDNPYEVIKVLESWLSREEFIGFLKGNVIKYQPRAKEANDHAKSAWYANYLVEFEKRSPKP